MNRVKNISKQTQNRFLNLYELEVEHRDGKVSPYFLASRSEEVSDLKIITGKNTPDGAVIYGNSLWIPKWRTINQEKR